MNRDLPYYKHVFCDCGGIIRVKDICTFICEKCGKEFASASLDYKYILGNNMTGQSYPVVDRED